MFEKCPTSETKLLEKCLTSEANMFENCPTSEANLFELPCQCLVSSVARNKHPAVSHRAEKVKIKSTNSQVIFNRKSIDRIHENSHKSVV